MNATEALERRIDELCRENERLRSANAAFTGRSIRAGDKMDCLNTENAKLRSARDVWQENDAKLRELLRDVVLLAGVNGCDVTNMQLHVDGGDWRTIGDRMRELGILEEA